MASLDFLKQVLKLLFLHGQGLDPVYVLSFLLSEIFGWLNYLINFCKIFKNLILNSSQHSGILLHQVNHCITILSNSLYTMDGYNSFIL